MLEILLALSLATPPSAGLERASREVSELKFKQAAVSLDAVERLNGLTREQVLQFYELRARVAASLGKEQEATEAFEVLLELEPTFELKGRASPKLTAPLFEARATVDRRGPLAVAFSPTERDGRLETITVELTGAARVAQVRITGLQQEVIQLPAPSMPLVVNAAEAQLKVTLEGPRGWVLLTRVETFKATQLEVVPQPVLSTTPVVVEAAPLPAPVVTARAHPARTIGIVSGSVGAASAVVGAGLYAFGSSSRATYDRAVSQQMNGIVPLTFDRAEQLSREVLLGRDGSTVSWVVAGGLIVVGAVLWLVDALAN